MAAVQPQRYVAPPSTIQQQPNATAVANAPVNPAAGVPDLVEDRRADSFGNLVAVRQYQRGRLLGKVSKCISVEYNLSCTKLTNTSNISFSSLLTTFSSGWFCKMFQVYNRWKE